MDPSERLRQAWNDAGPRPDVHEAAKWRLRAEWPTLYDALVAFAAMPAPLPEDTKDA